MAEGEKTAPGPILRLLKLLRYLTEIDGEVSIRDASRALDIPVSTVHRLLNILVAEGFAEKNPRIAHYGVGTDLVRMGFLLANKKGVNNFAAELVREVVDECNEACMFVAYLPATHQVSVMAAVNSSHPLRYEMELFVPHSLLWGATGRSILAFLPEQAQRDAYERAMPSPVTGQNLPEWDAFKALLDQFRARGYVSSRNQKVSGAVGLGAPVFSGNGVIGALCITIPEIRFEAENEAIFGNLLRKKAESFSRSLGFAGKYPG